MCEIIPKKILKNIAENEPDSKRKSAYKSIIADTKEKEYRQKRKQISQNLLKGIEPDVDRAHTEHLTVYDNQNKDEYVTNKLWEEFIAANHATTKPRRIFTKNLDNIYDLFHDLLNRESFDNQNATVTTYLKYSRNYNNAYWSGTEFVFGTGDKYYFKDFSKSFDTIAHEYMHGVTQWESNLQYENQSGALNESLSDVFGITAYQKKYDLTVDKSDWIIGKDIFTNRVNADGLRNMKNPGTAYDDNVIGKDDQPFDMSEYVELPNTEEGDWGGVHINSSIFNRIYYLTNEKLGGKSWLNGSMNIWYNAMLKQNGLNPYATFTDFAHKLIEQGTKLYGNESKHVEALKIAIDTVGVKF
jgi:Zn-dependent metalloprotease